MKTSKILTILAVALGFMSCGTPEALAGDIVGWGSNFFGESSPPADSDFVAIDGGRMHSLALKSDGSIVGWGHNGSGQISCPDGNDYLAIAAGYSHSLALKADGSIVGWGNNGDGQINVPDGNDYMAIAAGPFHSLALKNDGSIVAWGNDSYGQSTPPAGNDYVAITPGEYHGLALRADGSIVGWGADWYGMATPPPGNNFVAVAAGSHHSLALKDDGSIVAWGINDGGSGDYGQVTDTPDGNDYMSISAGQQYNLALKSDGSIVGWGRNEYGQATPPAGYDFEAIATGWIHSLALRGVAIGTAFTYQGRLIDSNSAADGLYDFEFRLYDYESTQRGNTVKAEDLDVIDGYFTLELDFGDAYDGNRHWLEVAVRPGGSNDPNAFVTLSPRQEVTPTPYAIHAKSAAYVKSADYANMAGHANTADYANMAGSTAAGITGSGTADYLPKFIDSNTVGDSAIYESGGNVGIGTINPSQKLDVAGGATISGNVGIGTGNPTSPLTVNGIIESTIGGVKFPDGTNQTSASTGDGYSLDAADGSPTDALYVDNAGNVGIGTLGPQEKLEINGKLSLKGATYSTVLSDDGGGLMIDTSRLATVAQFRLLPYDNDIWLQNANSGGDICFSGYAGEDLTGDIILKTAGNVGIGTTSPTQKLDVAGNIAVSGTVDGVDLSAHAANANAHHTPPTTLPPSGPAGGDLSGTYPNPSVVNDSHSHGNGTVSDNISINNGCLYALSGSGNVGIGMVSPTSKLDVNGNIRGNTLLANMWYDRDSTAYYVDPGSTGTSATFAGNMGIGTSSPSGRLQVAGDEVRIGSGGTIDYATGNGDLYVQDSLEVDGAVYMQGVRAYSMTGRDVMVESSGRLGTLLSSKRYKENIVPLEDDFTKILEAQPVAFIWKESKEPDIGLIAEDMDELGLRNLVFYDAEGRPESVRYKFVSLYLLEVLKDQANSIKELKAENQSLKEQLKSENQSLKQRLNALERTVRQIAKAKEIKL